MAQHKPKVLPHLKLNFDIFDCSEIFMSKPHLFMNFKKLNNLLALVRDFLFFGS